MAPTAAFARPKAFFAGVFLALGRAFVRLQVRRPGLVLFGAALATIGALIAARGLELYTQYEQLLPETQPSVKEYRRISSRLSSQSKAFLVLEGEDGAALRQLGDRLVTRLASVGAPAVVTVEDGVHDARAFLQPRAMLFARTDELVSLRDELRTAWDDAVATALDTGLDDDAPSKSSKWDSGRIRQLLGPRAALADRFPDGYYQAPNGKVLIVAIRTGIQAGDLAGARDALDRIRSEVSSESAGHDAGIRIGYAGDLVTGLQEYGAIRADLISVGIVGVAGVLAVILLYFLRLGSLFAMGCSILAGCAWTFAVTRFTIGHLNVVTGFLFSIIAGNGINCGIIFLARFREERRQDRDVAEAIGIAHRETWVATLTAALAAAASYGSLAASDFRGLKHFAVIGAAGMVLCWLATYAVLPAILILVDRRPRIESGHSFWSRLTQRGIPFDAPFTFLLSRWPRTVAAAGLALSVVGSIMAVSYFRGDPIEYDMKRLFNQVGGGTDQKRLSTLARDIVGVDAESSMSIACDALDQVPRLEQALTARRNAAPTGQKPFEAVHTIFDFVPRDQAEKIPLAIEIRRLLLRARAHNAVDDATWREVEPYLPSPSLAAFGMGDLPAALARPFTERDGTRGRLVLIEPTHGEDEDDAHYLIRWAESFRETKLSDNETIFGSGRVVIFADMLRAVLADVPRATVLSLALTIAIVVATAGFTWEALAILGSLLVGVAWLFAFIVLLGVKLNFLNFVALPITFGIGVDYAVNVVRRYQSQPGERALGVLRRTGGAVVLCSLTTIIGYLALLGSKNQAVHSLGLVAVLGEICCLGSAILVLPAVMMLIERRRVGSSVPPAEPTPNAP